MRLVLDLPLVDSKKNATVPRRRGRGGPMFTGKKPHIEQQERTIRQAVRRATQGVPLPLFGELDDVHVRVVWLWRRSRLRVTIESMGPPPTRGRSKATGRTRDMHNMLDTLLDALQGVAFRDDRQVARLSMRKQPGD